MPDLSDIDNDLLPLANTGINYPCGK
jgi:hypothetical protein